MNMSFANCVRLLMIGLTLILLSGCGGDKESKTPEASPASETEPAATEDQAPVSAEQTKESEIKSQTATNTETQPEMDNKKSQENLVASSTAETPEQDPMLALAKKSGCLACHSVEKKIVGPAWKDVAKRYADDASIREKLIDKVSKGGKGNWTDVTGGVAMPPYYPRVSNENIARLVDFVLALPH